MKHPKPNAFTLVETLVIIALMAVLGIMGGYAQIRNIQKQALLTAADTMVIALENARTQSIAAADNGTWAVDFEISPTRITQYCYATCNPGALSKTYTLPSPVQYNTLPPYNRLLFQKTSGRTSGPGLNQILDQNTTINLITNLWTIDVIIPPHGAIYVTKVQKR